MRKVCLVNWEQLCESTNLGGVSLKKAGVTNLALLLKLGWRIVQMNDVVFCTMVVPAHLKLHHLKGRVKECLGAWEFLRGPNAKGPVQHEELIY